MKVDFRALWMGSAVLLGLSALTGLASCSSLKSVFDRQPDSSLDQVDSLLGQVERAHLECELSRQASLDALDALHAVVAPDFRGDAIEAHQELLDSLEISVERAANLRGTLAPMVSTAGEVVEQWNADLQEFTSPQMRALSAERLAETNQLYVQVHASLKAAADFYEIYNMGLTDHALFLGNDLNAISVASIEEQLALVTEVAKQLDGKLLVCMEACQGYVRDTALRGQLAVPQVAAVEPTAQMSLRPGVSTQP